MTEVYPQDQELLNLASDAETGVEYIETGRAPYYLEFRRLVHRLLAASRRANDLRVFDEGGLETGVKAGNFACGGSVRSYAGSTGNTLMNNAENYVYLNGSGVLQITTAGYPPVGEHHVRLARVTTSGGDIVQIQDDRGVHLLTAFGFPVGERSLVSHSSGGITGGGVAVKVIQPLYLKGLLNGSTVDLFDVEEGDLILAVKLIVKTAAGAACTVSIGTDAGANGIADDPDSLLKSGDANATGIQASDTPGGTYTGEDLRSGSFAAKGNGHITISSSSNQMLSDFEGQAALWYLPG